MDIICENQPEKGKIYIQQTDDWMGFGRIKLQHSQLVKMGLILHWVGWGFARAHNGLVKLAYRSIVRNLKKSSFALTGALQQCHQYKSMV